MAETKQVTGTTKVKGGNNVKVENTKPATKKQVTVNDVKPQITFVKRHLHKFMETKGVNGKGSTKTKPVMKTKADEKVVKQVTKEMDTLFNKMLEKYPHTSSAQKSYIKNHLQNQHTPKYITHEKK